MEYVTDVESARVEGRSIVTLGKFDGLHRGHQQLFQKLKLMKQKSGFKTVAFTFNTELLFWKFGDNFKCILEREERRKMFEKLDVDMMIECPFSDEIRNMDAEDFVRKILVERLHASCIVIGKDFRFGHNRTGDYQLLSRLSGKYDFELQLIDEVFDRDIRISSSAIREAIAQGRMEDANRMLGYAFSVEGEILNGQKLGRTIDMPTINLIPSANKLLPPFGVYSSFTQMDGVCYSGVTNIGRKPTVGEFAVGVETHLLHTSGDFYGKFVRVSLLHFQRPEQKFPSVELLKEQMHKDARNAEQYLSKFHT
ncbi:MAG: bifunctional riboflavin kinase/FAD synthetase [Lachnospiraceae bacterium]|nr:bifunctional riboflavin kinase/FAD synthetase [Lachnospiraceae bacterium]